MQLVNPSPSTLGVRIGSRKLEDFDHYIKHIVLRKGVEGYNFFTLYGLNLFFVKARKIHNGKLLSYDEETTSSDLLHICLCAGKGTGTTEWYTVEEFFMIDDDGGTRKVLFRTTPQGYKEYQHYRLLSRL